MSATCERSRELIVGRLYGELSPTGTAELDEHLQTCAACRQEAEALAATRERVRPSVGLEPPRGSRARIMAAVAREAQRTPAAAPPFLDRFQAWFRGRWALPTLATVGVAAGVLLASRVLIDPKKTAEMAGREKPRQVVSDTDVPERLAPAAPAGPPAAEGTRSERLDRVAEPAAKAPARAESKSRAHASRPGRVEGLGDLGRAAAKGASARDAKTAEEKAAPAPAPPPAGPSRTYATPPGGWAAKPKAKAEAAPVASPDQEKRSAHDDSFLDREPSQPAPSTTGGSVRQGPSQAPAPTMGAAPQPAAEAVAPASAPAHRSRASSSDGASAGERAARAPDDLVTRTERLYTEGKLSEAAAGYRDLLKRFPQDSRARFWRSRLDALSARGL